MDKRVLYLSVKKEWFDMIASGEKKEEYREMSTYWSSRLSPFWHYRHFLIDNPRDLEAMWLQTHVRYTHVLFINGRNSKVNRTIEKEIKDIYKGYPKSKWCPEEMRNKCCWIIKLK